MKEECKKVWPFKRLIVTDTNNFSVGGDDVIQLDSIHGFLICKHVSSHVSVDARELWQLEFSGAILSFARFRLRYVYSDKTLEHWDPDSILFDNETYHYMTQWYMAI